MSKVNLLSLQDKAINVWNELPRYSTIGAYKSVNKNDGKYIDLIKTVVGDRIPKPCRNGYMLESFGVNVSFSMRRGERSTFPLFTGRKLHTKGVLGELAAFLQGATNLKTFKDLGCNYWDEFAAEDGNLGPIYGANWVDFNSQGFNQLQQVVRALVEDPYSRRHIVTAWNPAQLHLMALPPCHFAFQFNVTPSALAHDKDRLSLLVNMRSLDLMLGFPSDVLLYGVLLELIAQQVGLTPHKLKFSIGSCHIYAEHIDDVAEFCNRVPTAAPQLELNPDATIDNFKPSDVAIHNYTPGEPIKFALLP